MVATMPPNSPTFILIIISICFLSFSSSTLASNEDNDQNYVQSTSRRKALDLLGKEKLSHLRVFWHDVVSGPQPTSITVIQPPTNNTYGFGSMQMIDNPLTTSSNLKTSEVVGRAQGFYTSAAQEGFGLVMVMNLVFSKGKYNGSSLTIQGRNAAQDKVREMPIVGGSGLFRFARGYAEAQTRSFDLKTGDANVEYNLYVLHY